MAKSTSGLIDPTTPSCCDRHQSGLFQTGQDIDLPTLRAT